MKRLRRWFLNFLLVLVTAIISLHLVWKYTPAKQDLKVQIVRKLRPHLGDSFDLNDFTFGFGYIAFHKVKTSNSERTFILDFDEIRVGYSFTKLITTRIDPLQVIESVTFKRPHLILFSSQDTLAKRSDSLSAVKIAEDLLVKFQKFPLIDRMLISEGKITWKTPEGRYIPLIESLDGYLIQQHQGTANLDLRGKLFGFDNSSVLLKGTVDFVERNWRVRLNMDDCTLSSRIPFFSNGKYQLDNALLTGEIQIENSTLIIDSLKLSGGVRIRDLSVYFFNQHARAPEVNIRFMDRSLFIEKFTGKIEEGDARFEGVLENIFNPRVHFTLDVQNYHVKHLKQSHNIFEHACEGRLKGHFEFNGPIDQMEITGQVSSPSVLYAIIPFSNVRARLRYFNRKLEFPYIRADFRQLRNRGSGNINFINNQLVFYLSSDLRVPRNTFRILDRMNEANILLKTAFAGDFSQKLFGGTFVYTFQKEDGVLLHGKGPFKLNDQLLTFRLLSEDLSDTLRTEGRVTQLFSNPNFKILDLKNFPVRRFSSNPIVTNLAKDYRVNLYFSGPYNYLNGKVNILYRSTERRVFTLLGSIRDLFMEEQRFKGRFLARTEPLHLEGNYELSYTKSGIKAQITVPDLLYGSLFMAYASDGPFKGKLNIGRFSISDYLASSPIFSSNVLQGFIEGEVTFSGTVARPDVQFNITASEFIINKVGYYSTQLIGNLQSHRLTFDDFEVRLNEAPVFNAGFSYDILADTMELDIQGENIESNFLAETIFEDPDIIRGSFSYSITAHGPASSPFVSGNVQVRNGIFESYPFDLITISFEDSVTRGSPFYDLKEHLFKIRKFLYVNHQEYSIEGSGLVSVDRNGPIELELNVKGDILAELPKIETYFQNPHSDGILYARIGGTRADPFFEEARLQIYNGSLEFESVIPPIKNLQAEIILEKNSNFVHIKNISGTLGDRWARIYNVPRVSLTTDELSPWYFEDLGLNFGILVLETDLRGIPLSIPGLMQEGDIGYFAAGGQKEGEKFYFAGPPELPHARGTIVLNNCRVTFPFLGMEEGSNEENRVVSFLMNVHWNVLALAGTGNRYFVDIPAYVGKVYMDLNIDDTSEGLLFTGRLADESFRVAGSAESSRGRVEYLDVNFRVEKFGAEFNTFDIFPAVYGRAYTTIRDSTGNFPRDVYLVLYALDPETGEEISKGRWENFRFKLVSSDPTIGETQEQVLSYLGYSIHNIQNKAGEVGLTMSENFLIRPLVRPLERRLERGLGLDYVRLKSNFTSNLFYLSFLNRLKFFKQPLSVPRGLNNNLDPALLLLQSSEITLGKYLIRNVYLTYTGQLVSVYEEAKLGFNHKFGLEYRLLRNLLLEVEYDKFLFNPIYYNRQALNDLRIRLRHSFNF